MLWQGEASYLKNGTVPKGLQPSPETGPKRQRRQNKCKSSGRPNCKAQHTHKSCGTPPTKTFPGLPSRRAPPCVPILAPVWRRCPPVPGVSPRWPGCWGLRLVGLGVAWEGASRANSTHVPSSGRDRAVARGRLEVHTRNLRDLRTTQGARKARIWASIGANATAREAVSECRLWRLETTWSAHFPTSFSLALTADFGPFSNDHPGSTWRSSRIYPPGAAHVLPQHWCSWRWVGGLPPGKSRGHRRIRSPQCLGLFGGRQRV